MVSEVNVSPSFRDASSQPRHLIESLGNDWSEAMAIGGL
jgi:hypothetical protein